MKSKIFYGVAQHLYCNFCNSFKIDDCNARRDASKEVVRIKLAPRERTVLEFMLMCNK